jgi:hypothetical protein
MPDALPDALPAAPLAVRPWIDFAAIGASALCLLHCVGVPLLLAVLPGFGLLADLPEGVHEVLLAVALPLGVIGLGRGWLRHRVLGILTLGMAGLATMALAILFEDRRAVEVALTVAGVIAVATAHILNWRALHRAHRHG